jgi:copper transport protein
MSAANLSFFQAVGSPMFSLVTGTDWGHWWIWRILFLAMMVFFLDAPSDWRTGESGRWRYRLGFALPVIFGGAVLLTLSFVSHASGVTQGRTGAVIADWLHLVAAAFWVGGLFHLTLALPVFRKALPPEEARGALAALVPKFSSTAILSVAMLIASGIYSSLFVITTARAWFSPYGLILQYKIYLVFILLSLGALNLLWVRPSLKKDTAGVSWLTRLVQAEAAVAVIILLAMGMLTNMQPPQPQISQPSVTPSNSSQFDSTLDGVHVTISIQPAKFGPNSAAIILKNAGTGAAITTASVVSLTFTCLTIDLGQNTVYARQTSPGNYVVQNVSFNSPGAWKGALLVTRPDAFDVNLTFQFTVSSN